MPDYDKLRDENADVIKHLSRHVDFSVEVPVDFTCPFPSKPQAEKAAEVLNKDRILPEGVLIVASEYSPEIGAFDCMFQVRMIPDLDEITKIEFGFGQVCEKYGGGATAWGFASERSGFLTRLLSMFQKP